MKLQAALEWEKRNGLIPAVVQDAGSGAVLMLGYMNREALAATESERQRYLLEPQQGPPMDQGRDLRSLPRGVQISADCDRRHSIDPGRARGAGLSSGHRYLLGR